MVDKTALFKLSYGLFVLTARDGETDNGCIINTAMQIADNPLKIIISVNKNNYTHNMILETGSFNISVLTEDTPFYVFQHYGFKSGRDTKKIIGSSMKRSENSIVYLSDFSNACISGRVIESIDCKSHTLFIADVTESFILSDRPSATYQYYFDNIKPKPEKKDKKGFVCTVCGYVYEKDSLPEDFVCPVCHHTAEVFKPL